MLDDLDKELEARGHRFSRYADDFLIFVRSRSAAERVLRTVTRFIKGHLALIINEAKSKAARLRECTFLGTQGVRASHRTVASPPRLRAVGLRPSHAGQRSV